MCLAFATPALAHEPLQGLAAIVDPLLPSVVSITIWAPADAETPPYPDGTKADRTRFFGSGFLIDPTGIIVTNAHVVKDAYSVTVKLSDGRTTPGQIVAANTVIDLAVVKVNMPEPLPVLHFADSDKLHVGDPVLAIGNPQGIGLSVSAGIVSALNRDINGSMFGGLIQTDAAINHGNSGGPLVNLQGEVVGVDSSLYNSYGSGSVGLGFAIPANDAKFVVDRLLKYGEIRAGWTGATIQNVGADIAAALHLPTQNASVIAEVTPGSPGAKAGLQEGDLVLKVGDTVPSDAGVAMRTIAEAPIGETLPIAVWRRGQEMTFPVPVSTYPADITNQFNTKGLMVPAGGAVNLAQTNYGLHVMAITPELRQKYGLSADQQGVVVVAVERDTPASYWGINPGSVILRAMDTPVSTPEDFAEALRRTHEAALPFAAVLVRAGQIQRWVAISTTN